MIDWGRVQCLHDEIGAEAFFEVVDLFIAEIGATVDDIRNSPDPAQLQMHLHFLKGGVLNLGFTEVAALCQAAETLASQGQWAQVDARAVCLAYDSAREVLMAELSLRLA